MPKCINTSLVPRRDLSLSVMASLPLSSLVLFPLLGISFLVFFRVVYCETVEGSLRFCRRRKRCFSVEIDFLLLTDGSWACGNSSRKRFLLCFLFEACQAKDEKPSKLLALPRCLQVPWMRSSLSLCRCIRIARESLFSR